LDAGGNPVESSHAKLFLEGSVSALCETRLTPRGPPSPSAPFRTQPWSYISLPLVVKHKYIGPFAPESSNNPRSSLLITHLRGGGREKNLHPSGGCVGGIEEEEADHHDSSDAFADPAGMRDPSVARGGAHGGERGAEDHVGHVHGRCVHYYL